MSTLQGLVSQVTVSSSQAADTRRTARSYSCEASLKRDSRKYALAIVTAGTSERSKRKRPRLLVAELVLSDGDLPLIAVVGIAGAGSST